MKFFLKNILLVAISLNFCYSSSLDNLKTNEFVVHFKDELIKDVNEDIYQSNRKKLVKIGLSGLFPGLGHFYSGNKKMGGIYSMIEIASWMGRDRYLSRAEISAKEYKEYAEEHWSLARWFKDYFNPKGEYAEDIRSYFTKGGEEPFARPWDNSHYISFEYNEGMASTRGSFFEEEIYPEVCGIVFNPNAMDDDLICNASIDDIVGKIGAIEYDHHFFEGISKYNLYFAGWDDNSLGYMKNIGGYPVAYTPHKKYYENTLRAKHKRNNNTADDFVAMLLINRAVSMLDIILRKTNNISINTSSNYEIDNKYRINSIHLSVGIN